MKNRIMKKYLSLCRVIILLFANFYFGMTYADVIEIIEVDEESFLNLDIAQGNILVDSGENNEIKIESKVKPGSGDLVFEAHDQFTTIEFKTGQKTELAKDNYFHITVPKSISIVGKTVSGNVRLIGLDNPVDFDSFTGSINVQDSLGRFRLKTMSGKIILRDNRGEVSSQSISGEVELHNNQGDIDVHTVSGNINANFNKSRNLEINSSTGEVSTILLPNVGNRMTIGTSSGDIRAYLSEKANAKVNLRIGEKGRIDNRIVSVEALNDGEKAKMQDFTLGAGGSNISLNTLKGSIILNPVQAIENGGERFVVSQDKPYEEQMEKGQTTLNYLLDMVIDSEINPPALVIHFNGRGRVGSLAKLTLSDAECNGYYNGTLSFSMLKNKLGSQYFDNRVFWNESIKLDVTLNIKSDKKYKHVVAINNIEKEIFTYKKVHSAMYAVWNGSAVFTK